MAGLRSSSLFTIPFLGGLLLLTQACVTDPISGRRELSVVRWSVEEELEIGNQAAPSLIAQMDGPFASASAQSELGNLLEEMVSHSPRAEDFEFDFILLASSIPNALALPGGRVFMTRGLLAELRSEAEFIAVLGHELGHVERRHTMERLSDNVLLHLPLAPLRVVSRILPFGGGVVESAADAASVPSELLGLSFSRTQELEADERGVFFANAMGYDPRSMIGVFEVLNKLDAADGESGAPKLSVLRTHPLNKSRIQCVEKVAKPLALPEGEYRGDSPAFTTLLEQFRREAPAFAHHDHARAELEALLNGPETSEEQERAALQEILESLGAALTQLPEEPLFHITAGEIAFLAGNLGAAEQHLLLAESVYARETPGFGHWKPPFYIGLLRSAVGEHQPAVEALQVALQRFPENPQIQAALEAAQIELQSGESEEGE